MRLTLGDIGQTYEAMRAQGRRSIEAGDYATATRLIEAAATIAYNFNWVYTDDELEAQVRAISSAVVRSTAFTPQPGRVVFYDSWGMANRGLTQQYVRALVTQGIEFLFVFENESASHSRAVRAELEAYGRCEVFAVDQSLPLAARLQATYSRIQTFRPEKLLMHITPWAVEALAVFHALTPVTKYLVNLTDHAFWLGSSVLNYCIEFRSYGCTVSLEKRRLRRDQLLLLPYYPITSGDPFQGFPEAARDRLIVLSGSSYYKIYGRNGKYFQLARRLLQENPECVLLFAGGGDGQRIERFIADNRLQGRFILLGSRSDISQVFAHCDIYLGTYPMCGALMTQLAAAHSKPVLAYTTPDLPGNFVEAIISAAGCPPTTFTDEQALFAEARKLMLSKVYREDRGRALCRVLTTPEDFNRSLSKAIERNRSPLPVELTRIDYDCFSQYYLEIENDYLHTFKRILVKTFGVSAAWRLPIVFFKCLPGLFSLALRRASRRGSQA